MYQNQVFIASFPQVLWCICTVQSYGSWLVRIIKDTNDHVNCNSKSPESSTTVCNWKVEEGGGWVAHLSRTFNLAQFLLHLLVLHKISVRERQTWAAIITAGVIRAGRPLLCKPFGKAPESRDHPYTPQKTTWRQLSTRFLSWQASYMFESLQKSSLILGNFNRQNLLTSWPTSVCLQLEESPGEDQQKKNWGMLQAVQVTSYQWMSVRHTCENVQKTDKHTNKHNTDQRLFSRMMHLNDFT